MGETLHEFQALVREVQQVYAKEIQAFTNLMRVADGGPALSNEEEEVVRVAQTVPLR